MKLAMVNLTGGGLSGGYLKYLVQLVPLLQADPRIRRLQVFMPPGSPWPEVEDLKTFTWLPDNARQDGRWLQAQLRQLAPDVVFVPTARWLECGRIPTVVMVRNMEPLAVPFRGNKLLEGVKNMARAYIAREACQRAARVMAVSQHVRDFLVEEWKISPQKIGLVYHGVELAASRAATVKPHAVGAHGLKHFIFAAGSIRPARGLEDVVRAMAIVGARDPALSLVIAGQPDVGTEFYGRRMRRLAHGLGIGPRVVWLGQLRPLEMAWCFFHCAAFVVTSRAEACPNIALEAMSHGCQVVSTSQPPMPEFFAEAALYYEPEDVSGLAAQIATVLAATTAERRARQESARVRARSFRWSDTAQRTIEQLALAMNLC